MFLSHYVIHNAIQKYSIFLMWASEAHTQIVIP
jgi:hypothetical protein